MEKEDLIKKLEKIELPEIEVPGHKEKLRSSLISQYLKEKKREEVFSIYKKTFFPIGTLAAILVIALVLSNLVFPQYTLAKAKEIALRDPRVKELIAGGGEIKDIKIIKDKAFILITPKEISKEREMTLETRAIEPKKEFPGALAELNLREKKVLKIEKITFPISSLTEKEKAKIRTIIESPEILKLGKPEIKEIKPPRYFPQRLIKKGKEVEVFSERKTSVIYEVGKSRWQGRVNLNEGKIEATQFLGKTEK